MHLDIYLISMLIDESELLCNLFSIFLFLFPLLIEIDMSMYPLLDALLNNR